MKNSFLHKEFRLNGQSFKNREELLQFINREEGVLQSFLSNWLDNSDFIKVSTSGSTGKPKMIELRKEFMINSAKATGKFFNLKAGTTALLCLPIQYIAGKMMLVRAVVLGWHIDVVESGSKPLKGIKKHYNFSAMVPLQLFHSLDNMDKIDTLIVGGGIVSSELQAAILDLPSKMYATYGMTETITHIAIKPLNIAAGMDSKKDYYRILENVSIGLDERKCLVIQAPKVSIEKIVTNDLVEIISEKEFKWLGRYDHIINSGGIKLIPEQIEEKLSKIITKRFFVAGFPDDRLGEKLVLIIEDQNLKFDIQNIKDKFKGLKSLTRFEIPKEIYAVNTFILTETNKIQRKKTLEKLKV